MMKILLVTAVCCIILTFIAQGTTEGTASIEKLQEDLEFLTRQVMLQQLYVDEMARGNGDSGIKLIRNIKMGPKNYFSDSHAGDSIAAAHDHADHYQTVGLGELTAVLNGVDFRTRHNDYSMVMPHTTEKWYTAVEGIPFPDVPPEVLEKETVTEQVSEMREWFKAFKNQDYVRRDYRKYFKPALCYMEGTWTTSTGAIDESFDSDRHHLEAKTWLELQDKIRFTSYTGGKNQDENYAYLPTTIMDIVNGTAVLAQWNYRILCHPLENDLPLNRLRVADDLKSQLFHKRSYTEIEASRAARYQLNPVDSEDFKEQHHYYQLLDQLMEQVPGQDNYRADIVDDTEGTAYHANADMDNDPPLNVGYYHRVYKTRAADAMGNSIKRRGFNDANVFMAATTSEYVSPMRAEYCEGTGDDEVCTIKEERWTYAVPMEIIYMTPLSNWNPYNIEYKGSADEEYGQTVTSGGRYGDTENPDKAYNGLNNKIYYQTPKEFFEGGEPGHSDPADTSGGVVGVLNRNGELCQTVASGHYIHLPDIPGVGVIRQRYPIMPVHGEGSSVYKELNALKDIILENKKYTKHYKHADGLGEPDNFYVYKMSMSTNPDITKHSHYVEFDQEEMDLMANGTSIQKLTSTDIGHEHNLDIERFFDEDSGEYKYRFTTCDGGDTCFDWHGSWLWMPAQ